MNIMFAVESVLTGWPLAMVICIGIVGFLCFLGIVITERWPWER